MGEFVYTPLSLQETIAAICTPPGEGGVAIVRICGEKALEIVDKLFSGPVSTYKSHTCHFGVVKSLDGTRIDEALLLVMHKERSFTGQTTVELQCHGGHFASRKILQALCEAGVRLARPGEFALRSFLNGKIDLTQAEAIQELIVAKNERAFTSASNHLAGTLADKIKTFQKKLTHLAAILEAWVDFPEEGIEFTTAEQITSELASVLQEMQKLHATFEDGQKIRDGICLALVGPPNAGKSSLMNALLGKERAIVTKVAGTTRDLLEDDLLLGGLHFRLVDTAGMRDSSEEIEQEGIRRAKAMFTQADVILLVLDASRQLTPEDQEVIEKVPKEKMLLVWNKIDLPRILSKITYPRQCYVSAIKGEGLQSLIECIQKFVWEKGSSSKEEVILTSMRHKEALFEAIKSCEAVLKGLKQGDSPEFLSFEMRGCLKSLGTILGTNVTEDILSSIFSQFCIGK